MTAYDRLRKVQDSQYGLAAAAPSDVAALLDEHEKLREELDALRKQEPVAHLKRGTVIWSGSGYVGQIRIDPVTATADWGRSKKDIPLYAAPVPAQPAVPEGYTPVRTEVLLWLLGENGDFECPPAQYFRGKPAPYFWRKRLRESMLSAPVPAHPAVPDDVARDAARYRWLREHSQTGSVKTLLPLERCHYVVVHESAYEYQSFDDAIDAAIISATEGRKDE